MISETKGTQVRSLLANDIISEWPNSLWRWLINNKPSAVVKVRSLCKPFPETAGEKPPSHILLDSRVYRKDDLIVNIVYYL